MNEPDYYTSNGLSPIGAFKQGLISKDEYRGFLIGNVIKYVIRAGKKEDAVKDLNKAKTYLDFYLELIESNDIKVTVHVDNDLVNVDFKGDIEELTKTIYNELMEDYIKGEVPTEDPNILEVKLSEALYDETGTLKPEARESIKKYLLKKRGEYKK